jgi:hypothetical protein
VAWIQGIKKGREASSIYHPMLIEQTGQRKNKIRDANQKQQNYFSLMTPFYPEIAQWALRLE